MPVCHVALGGNLGPVGETFDRALEMLRGTPGVAIGEVSGGYRTRAVGTGPARPGSLGGDEFLNAAAEITTDRAPLELLDLLQSIETALGRTREIRWGPRTLDLDLLFYGNEIIETPRLTVPHPAAWYRRFVLDPLVEIAPDFVHPVKQIPLRELHARLLARPLRIALAGCSDDDAIQLFGKLWFEFRRDVQFSLWDEFKATFASPAHEPTFIVWLGSECLDEEFYDLPLVPRVDAANLPGSAEESVRQLIQSALGDA